MIGELVQINKYGVTVWVNKQMDEQRRDECLCLNCKVLHTCPIAAEGLRLAKLTDIAFMVTRCPKFIRY